MRSPSRLAMMLIWFTLSGLAHLAAQPSEPTAEEKKELLANQRFTEILKKKPRAGTALDRVYEFHITRGTLDDFCQQLRSEAVEQSSGQAAMLLGLMESRRGNDSLAKVAFEKAEVLLPKEPLASYYLGKTLLLLGDTERAITALQSAIDRQPDKADSLQIYQELGRVYQRSRRTEEAIKIWKRLEESFPGDLQVQEQIASVLEDEGAYAAALEKYAALATAAKDRLRQVELKTKAAALKLKLNQHAEAIQELEALLSQINPGSWLYQDIRRRIDDSFQSRKDTPGLTAYYESWIEKHPDDIDAMMRIGRMLSIARNSTAARQWFQRAIDRAPSVAEPRLALVDALERDGNRHDAASAMQALCELQPNNPDYIVRCGELLLSDASVPQAERVTAAADVWRKLLDKHADDPVMVARVADLMRGARLSDDAIKLYRRAIELSDAEPQYREYLGEYLFQLDRKQEAIKVWEELASGPRKNRDNLVRLSEVLSTFNFPSEALAAMDEACNMQPTFAHRLRYAAKLKEAERYTDALAQTKLATVQASGEEERDQVLDLEIKIHLAASDLIEQVARLEAETAGKEQTKSDAWKRLSLYQEAAGKTQPALGSIRQALQIDPQSTNLLEIAARLQEKSGFVGDAVATLRKLIALDRRGQSRILMQIASMQLRLGQMDEAIKTAQEMLAAADANTEQYRYYADLCFQAGKIDQGLDALRRHLRANPNNREAIDLLARALGNHFRTEEAIDLTWRSMTKAANTAERVQSVQALSELYTRSNDFEELIKRLGLYGREENRARESTILTAAAHQSVGDLASARELLEPLVAEDVRDTELLKTVIELARADGDWESAATYQTKLNNLSPSTEGGLQLAKFLLETGEVEQAEAVWNQYARKRMSPSDLQSNLEQLLALGENEKALGMIERALAGSQDDWEVLTVCMQMYVHAEKLDKARALADKILKLNIPRDRLVASARGPRSGQTAPTALPSANGTDRQSCMVRAMRIASSLPTNSTISMAAGQRRMPVPSIVCFADARLIALYLTSVDTNRVVKDFASLNQSVQQETDRDKLWDAAFLLNFAPVVQPGDAALNRNGLRLSFGNGGMPGQGFAQTVTMNVGNASTTIYSANPINPSEALRRLVDVGDYEAMLCLAQRAVSTFQLIQSWQQVGAARIAQSGTKPSAPRLDSKTLDEHLALLKKIQTDPVTAQNDQVVLLSLFVASELYAADRKQEGQEAVKMFQQNSRNAPKMIYARLLLPIDVDMAVDACLAAMKKQGTTPRQSSASPMVLSVSSNETALFLSELLDRRQAVAGLENESPLANLHRYNPLRLVSEMKKIQAERARRMRPSELANYSPSTSVMVPLVNRTTGGASSVQIIPFPSASPLQSPELLTAMYMINISSNKVYRDQLEILLRSEAEHADDDAMQSAVDHLCYAVWLYWQGNKNGAIEELEALRKTSVAGDLASMLGSRIYFESGRMQEALHQLEQINPITTELMQERDMAILQLAVKSSDKERAKKAAERLFAMRLQPRYETQVARLMGQLGMTEMSRSMMQRIQQRSGTQLSTLAQLMNQYRNEKNEAAAVGIAQQIVRRTKPNRSSVTIGSSGSTIVSSSSSSSSSSSGRANNDLYRQQAMQVLANSSEAKEQIKQLEARLKNNPKSPFLVSQLAEWYEVSGRAADANRLREQLKTNPKATSQAALAQTLANYRQTRSKESVLGYLALFENHPELFEREFDNFLTAVMQNRAWDSVASTIRNWPLERFANPSARMQQLINNTVLRASGEDVEKLAQKLLGLDDFVLHYANAFANAGRSIKLSPDTQNLIDNQLCQALTKRVLILPQQPTFQGHLRGSLSVVNALITSPASATKVLQTIEPMSEKNSMLKCLEVLMHLRSSDEEAARRALDEALAMPIDSSFMDQWELASELANVKRYQWALELMEKVDRMEKTLSRISETSPKTLLLECTMAVKNRDKAKAILDDQLAALQNGPTSVTSQPGFIQQDIEYAKEIAQKYDAIDCPVESLCTILWAKQNPALMPVLPFQATGNTYRNTLNQLQQTAVQKIEGSMVLQILRTEFQATSPTAGKASVIRIPATSLFPESIVVNATGALPESGIQELRVRFKLDATARADAKLFFSKFMQSKWREMPPRTLVIALYVADVLNEQDAFVTLAGELQQRYAEEKESNPSQELRALQPACWFVAEKLAEVKQEELALKFAAHGAANSEMNNPVLVRYQLRLAHVLQANDHHSAAEAQLRSVLDKLYPPSKSQTKN